MWIIVVMLPGPSTGLNPSASVRSIASCVASRGMTEVSDRTVSSQPASAR